MVTIVLSAGQVAFNSVDGRYEYWIHETDIQQNFRNLHNNLTSASRECSHCATNSEDICKCFVSQDTNVWATKSKILLSKVWDVFLLDQAYAMMMPDDDNVQGYSPQICSQIGNGWHMHLCAEAKYATGNCEDAIEEVPAGFLTFCLNRLSTILRGLTPCNDQGSIEVDWGSIHVQCLTNNVVATARLPFRFQPKGINIHQCRLRSTRKQALPKPGPVMTITK